MVFSSHPFVNIFYWRLFMKDHSSENYLDQLLNSVNGEYNDTKRSYDSVEVVLDEKVKSKEDVVKLGIMTGDFVCFDPRTTVTASGYIKSRFLDDKLSVGILLGYAKYLKE